MRQRDYIEADLKAGQAIKFTIHIVKKGSQVLDEVPSNRVAILEDASSNGVRNLV